MRLLFPSLASVLVLSVARGEDLPRLLPSCAAAYEGLVKVRQSSGESGGIDSSFKASVVVRAREESPGKSQVLAVRTLKAIESQDEPLVAFDAVTVEASGKGFTVSAPGEAPLDLEANAMRVAVVFPFELFPAFRAPASGDEETADGELDILGLAKVKASLVTSLKADKGRIELSRKLAPGAKPTFDIRGEGSTLLSWSEVYTWEPASGLPTKIERSVSVESKVGESRLRFDRSGALEAKKVESPTGEGASRLDAMEATLKSLNADYLALQPPEQISKHVEDLRRTAKGSLLEPAIEAMDLRLAAYRDTGLGQTAPDFTLESLEGKQLSFRAATRGKVVLLSFWGVGCPPCRKESPYLTKLQEKYAEKGFTVIAVNGWDETKEVVQQFVDKEKLTHPILLMGGETGSKLFKVQGYPTTILISHEGRMVHREMGFDPGAFPELEKRVEKLIAAQR